MKKVCYISRAIEVFYWLKDGQNFMRLIEIVIALISKVPIQIRRKTTFL